MRHLIRTAIAAVLATTGCGGGEPPISFSLEESFFPDLELDTGFLPADQPAQVRVVARTAGSLSAHAEADAVGGALEPVAGSGELALAAEMTLEVHANIDLPGVKFNGLVESFGYALPASAIAFDPFLLEAAATLEVALPVEEIATIPLAQVPGGSLRLTVEGGTVTAELAGGCAKADAEMAQFTGRLLARGVVELGATIVVDLPIGGSKEFGPFSVPVTLPNLDIAVDLGTFTTSGEPVDGPGPCDAVAGDGDGDGDGDGNGDGDGANCGLPTELNFNGVAEVGAIAILSGSEASYGFGGGFSEDDSLSFILAETGVFRDGIVPGIYQWTTADTGQDTCALCAFVVLNFAEDNSYEHLLMSESGTLSLSEVGTTVGSRVSATFTNLQFREMDVETGTIEVEGGCETRVSSISMNATIDQIF